MQLTFKFFMLSVALAYGGATALPVLEFPLVGRHEYDQLEVRGDSATDVLQPNPACSECSRAKVRCDRSEPECSRCGTKGYVCEYDQRKRKPKRKGGKAPLVQASDQAAPMHSPPDLNSQPSQAEIAYEQYMMNRDNAQAQNNSMHSPPDLNSQPQHNPASGSQTQQPNTNGHLTQPYVNNMYLSPHSQYSPPYGQHGQVPYFPGSNSQYAAPSNNVHFPSSGSHPQGLLTSYHSQQSKSSSSLDNWSMDEKKKQRFHPANNPPASNSQSSNAYGQLHSALNNVPPDFQASGSQSYPSPQPNTNGHLTSRVYDDNLNMHPPHVPHDQVFHRPAYLPPPYSLHHSQPASKSPSSLDNWDGSMNGTG